MRSIGTRIQVWYLLLIVLVVAGGPVLGTIVSPFVKAAAFLWQLVVF